MNEHVRIEPVDQTGQDSPDGGTTVYAVRALTPAGFQVLIGLARHGHPVLILQVGDRTKRDTHTGRSTGGWYR